VIKLNREAAKELHEKRKYGGKQKRKDVQLSNLIDELPEERFKHTSQVYRFEKRNHESKSCL